MKTLSIALAAAVLAVTPAVAGELTAPEQTVKIQVSTAGLNLSSPKDVARLQRRVDRAIVAACTPGGVYRAFQVTDKNCTARMGRDSQQIVANMTRDAQKIQSAEF